MCEDIGAEILNVTYYLELPQGLSMSKSVERSRNKLLYDSVVRGILETESNLAYENKKIYL